ncbi:MAG TPA: YtxH domain-containing protein, partial [Bacteroidia bacterium]|nr:YtxH domain-containing protein [Bacteroidia bacterium]
MANVKKKIAAKSGKSGLVKKLLITAAVGGAIGILLAPGKGKTTRGKLLAAGSLLWGLAKNKAAEMAASALKEKVFGNGTQNPEPIRVTNK